MHISIVGHGVDLLVGQDLHMFAAGPAVQLVDPDQPAAHAVRHFALLAYMLREIRRGLIGYLSEIRCHHSHQYVYICLHLIEFVFICFVFFFSFKCRGAGLRVEPAACLLVTAGNGLNTEGKQILTQQQPVVVFFPKTSVTSSRRAVAKLN